MDLEKTYGINLFVVTQQAIVSLPNKELKVSEVQQQIISQTPGLKELSKREKRNLYIRLLGLLKRLQAGGFLSLIPNKTQINTIYYTIKIKENVW